LQVEKNDEDEKHSNVGQDAFLIHEGTSFVPRPALWDISAATLKVNDPDNRVKRM